MFNAADIRQLYNPIQPPVKQPAEKVTYAEYLPYPELQPYIYCYWQLKTTQPLEEPFNYRVVADGCMDIFVELNKPDDSFVMGFCKKYTEFPLDNSFNYFGVRFLPTMFPQLFMVNAKALSNKYAHLNHVLPGTANFIKNNLNAALNTGEIKQIVDGYFLQQLAIKSFNNDHRLYGAIQIILENFGVIDIETNLNTGISSRQLRRLFEFYIGDTAKTFSKVVRFQNILKAKPSTQSLRQNKLFFDVGYYDQSHFIKEFKHFYGLTPSQAFGR